MFASNLYPRCKIFSYTVPVPNRRLCRIENYPFDSAMRIEIRMYSSRFLISTQFLCCRRRCHSLFISVQRPFDASSLLTVTDNDRLGLYGNASLFGLRKLNVPYSVNDTSGSWSFRLSQERFNDSLDPFVVGQLQVTVQDQSTPRTFEPYLSFCTTAGTTLGLLISQLSK